MEKIADNNAFIEPLTREEIVLFFEANKVGMRDIIEVAFNKLVEESFSQYNDSITNMLSSLNDTVRGIGEKYNEGIMEVNEKMLALMSKMNELEEVRSERAESAQKAMIDSMNNIGERVKEASEMSRKQYWAIQNANNTKVANPIFYNKDFNKKKQTDWLKIIKGSIVSICNVYGLNEGSVYNQIYSEMKTRYDLDALLAEYKRTFKVTKVERLEMIAACDALRTLFTLCCDRYIRKVKKEADSQKQVKKNVPDNKANLKLIYNAVSKLSSTGKLSGRVYNKAYHIVADNTGMDIKKSAVKVRKAKKLSARTSTPVAISFDNCLTDKFCSAIEGYLRG